MITKTTQTHLFCLFFSFFNNAFTSAVKTALTWQLKLFFIILIITFKVLDLEIPE